MSVSRSRRRHRGWIAAGVLIAVTSVAYFALRQSGSAEPAITYQTEAATTGTVSVTVSGTGNLEIDGTTDVYPAISGTVLSVKVAEGDTVTTGTALFTLDGTDTDTNIARALASYRQAQQGVTQSESQVLKAENALASLNDRYADQVEAASNPTTATATQQATEVTLADIAAATKDVTAAKAGLATAKASLASASLSYEQARSGTGDLTVTAPASGVIWSLDIATGDGVSPSTGGSSASATTVSAASSVGTSVSSAAPCVIASGNPLAVHLTVNEVDLPTLEVGQRAELEFDALPELTATGKTYKIADEGTVTQGVVTFDVWLALDVSDSRLRPGMSAAASIVTLIARDALLVPNAAVKDNTDGTSYVEVLRDDATGPVKVTVETGISSSTQTQITSGLKEGDKVVTQTIDAADTGTSGSGGGGMFPGTGGGPRG